MKTSLVCVMTSKFVTPALSHARPSDLWDLYPCCHYYFSGDAYQSNNAELLWDATWKAADKADNSVVKKRKKGYAL